MVPVLINKDVFELNYNDLKFRIQDIKCFCINLIKGWYYLDRSTTGVTSEVEGSWCRVTAGIALLQHCSVCTLPPGSVSMAS